MRQLINHSDRRRTAAVLLCGVLLGWLAATINSGDVLHADDRKPAPPPAAFLSGGERAAVVLEKISGQLTSIDQRLARIEAVVAGKKNESKK